MLLLYGIPYTAAQEIWCAFIFIHVQMQFMYTLLAISETDDHQCSHRNIIIVVIIIIIIIICFTWHKQVLFDASVDFG